MLVLKKPNLVCTVPAKMVFKIILYKNAKQFDIYEFAWHEKYKIVIKFPFDEHASLQH